MIKEDAAAARALLDTLIAKNASLSESRHRKLTAEQVRAARGAYELSDRKHGIISALARHYEIATPNMREILQGRSYRWVK